MINCLQPFKKGKTSEYIFSYFFIKVITFNLYNFVKVSNMLYIKK